MRMNESISIKQMIIVLVILTIITVIIIIFTPYYPSQIPTTPNKEFKIVSYIVPEPFSKGHLRFVIECENSKLQKEYYISEGKFFFGGYVDENFTTGYENLNVGGISCTPIK